MLCGKPAEPLPFRTSRGVLPMSIVAILNGYYRSGTTILFYLFKLSNPDMICLYEPTSPIITSYIRKYKVGELDDTHNLPIFDDYHKLPKEVLEEFIKRHSLIYATTTEILSIIDKPEKAVFLLEPIHNLDQPVFIKSCQLHFILPDIKKELKCDIIHVVRHPAEVLASHFSEETLNNIDKALEILISPRSRLAFWIDETYRIVRRIVGIDFNAKNTLEKFLVNYVMCNYHAVNDIETYNLGSIVCFEDIARNPHNPPKSISRYISKQYMKVISPNRAFTAPLWLKDIVSKKIKQLGLEFYYKKIEEVCRTW